MKRADLTQETHDTMKTLTYKHTAGNGDSTTITKGGATYLSALGQIDEELARRGLLGEAGTLAAGARLNLGRVLDLLVEGQPLRQYGVQPDEDYTLTPGGAPDRDWVATIGVIVEGGVVQNIMSSDRVRVLVVDHDNDPDGQPHWTLAAADPAAMERLARAAGETL